MKRQVGPVFDPLGPDNALIQDHRFCWHCGMPFRVGERTCTVTYEFHEQYGFRMESMSIHATCGYRGVQTSKGIIEQIKDEDGTPFPVIMEDGTQCSLEEAGLRR